MPLATSQLTETERSTNVLATLAIYWHLFSLDAPTVAALWSWSFARAAHVDIPLLAPVLLAVGTWLVYVADRILDGLDGTGRAHLRERHYFYLRHRQIFLVASSLVSPIFLWIVFTRMAPAARREDAAVFAVAALYFLLVHLRGRRARCWLPKELAVGILFAAATAVPAWARIAGHRLQLLPAVALFAALCWLNCVAIEKWERGLNGIAAHSSTLWAGRHLPLLTAITGMLGLQRAIVSIRDIPQFFLYLAIAMAAGLLFWLARSESRFSALQLRIAVDAALLTPLLFLVAMR